MLIRNRTVVARILLPLLLLTLLCVLPPAALAQTKTFHWADWSIDVTLQPDGSLAVTETQTLNFQGEPFSFGFRSIPTGRAGNNDGLRDVSVREGDLIYQESSSNAPGTFEVVDQGGETRINWYFEPALGLNTYTFTYVIDGAVRMGTTEDSGDQVFWTVIPSDHPARIDNSRATITLPEGFAPQKLTGTDDYLVAAYLNDAEAGDVAISVSEDGRVIAFQPSRPLMSGEKLDVRVQFPRGLLSTTSGEAAPLPEWQAREQRDDTIALGVLALSVLLLVIGPLGVVLLWYLRGRDPQLGLVTPDYVTEPPSDLPPAMVGSLIDEKVDMQDIVSTLVDLAHRGYLVMEEEKKSYNFMRTDKSDKDLRPYERTFLKDVFRGEESRSLSSLQYKFASKLPELRRLIDEALVSEGYLPRAPQSVRSSYTVLAVLVLLAGIGSLFVMGFFLGTNSGLACFPVLAIIATAIALFIAARHMPRKTRKGAEAAAMWNAFKAYLKNIKQYADIESSGDIFEKYLGYAIAFGMERSFINTFSRSAATPVPPWYIPSPMGPRPMGGGFGGPIILGAPRPSSSGGGGFDMPNLSDAAGGLTGGLSGMAGDLTRMLNSASNTLRSTPPPANTGGSRSGGFGGGGGFSGGFSGGSSGGGGSAGFG